MKVYDSSFLALLVTLFLSMCTQIKQKNDSVDTQPCDTLVYRVESFVTDLTNPRELFLSKDFLEIYNNALQYEECIKGVLESKQYNFVQKQICVYSLQKISNAQYIEFVTYCLKLYKEGRIDDKLLSLVLTPAPFDSKNRIIDNYSDKNIQAVLKSIIDSPVSSTPMRMKAESILSGKAFHDLEKMRKKEF